jgi:hypothetical protein
MANPDRRETVVDLPAVVAMADLEMEVVLARLRGLGAPLEALLDRRFEVLERAAIGRETLPECAIAVSLREVAGGAADLPMVLRRQRCANPAGWLALDPAPDRSGGDFHLLGARPDEL